MVSCLIVLALVATSCVAAWKPHAVGVPAPPQYWNQSVDHFSINSATFVQRFYENATSFGGAGSPIICILGGEGGISPSTGIFYPSIILLAARLGALIIEPEHRFYGASLPVSPYDTQQMALLTPQQALADAAAFIQYRQRAYGCSGENGQPRCPVVTVGGSYPGFLSAMMRLRYPAVVDIAYAASAPMGFYSQAVAQGAYYALVTASAEKAVAGCAAATRSMLAQTLASAASMGAIVAGANLCDPIPSYIDTLELLMQEVSMVVMYTFADLNMANWPPPATALQEACAGIVATTPSSPWGALAGFLGGFGAAASASAACYNLSAQLPAGANATISSGDWSGVGVGDDGASWDFETCTLLVETIGTNNVTDMFIPRNSTMDWLSAHCAARFGVVPQPRLLADTWGFDADRLADVTSNIIFTNGLNDGWSAGGIQVNLSDTLLAFNMPNGAHHSDLSHNWPSPEDTPDVTATREAVAQTIEAWLAKSAPPANV